MGPELTELAKPYAALARIWVLPDRVIFLG